LIGGVNMRNGMGIIEELLGDGLAKVKVNKDQLYVACSACIGAEHVFVTAHNEIGAKEGQAVRYEVEDRHLIAGAFMCFIVPLVAALFFGIIAYEGGLSLGYEGNALTVAGVLAGLLISGLLMRQYDHVLSKNFDTKATITDIILDDEEEEDEGRSCLD